MRRWIALAGTRTDCNFAQIGSRSAAVARRSGRRSCKNRCRFAPRFRKSYRMEHRRGAQKETTNRLERRRRAGCARLRGGQCRATGSGSAAAGATFRTGAAMRIDAIDLIRYGHFAGRSIELSARKPDFSVIYGDNEAGKSTLLRAISAMFFGVPVKTPDVHSCKGSELRVGATISQGHESLSFRRRKGTSATLLDIHEAQMAESALAAFLPELDRERFEQFFCLDHGRLREGGEELLHGKGDVGSALFQAAGLLGLRKLLENLEDEARELFSAKGRGRVIGSLIDEYKQARAELRGIAISAAVVKQIESDLEQARTRHETLKNEAQSLQ